MFQEPQWMPEIPNSTLSYTYYLSSYCNEESLALIFNLTGAEIFLQVQLCGVIWIRLVYGPICGNALD